MILKFLNIFYINRDNCSSCGDYSVNLRRHAMPWPCHMPWYMDPSTACVDYQRGEGCRRDVERFHCMHQRIIGDYLLEAWFLLMNVIFLLMARELGLGGIHDLLGYVVAHNLYPNIFRFSEDELFFFRDFDRRSGLER